MFILTGCDSTHKLFKIYDTTDGKTDVLQMSTIAKMVLSQKLRIYGVVPLGTVLTSTIKPLPEFGIGIHIEEARQMLAQCSKSH